MPSSRRFGGASADTPAGVAQARPESGQTRGARPALSLKGRALRYLSMREHSRVELARKLAPHAESEADLERALNELQAAGLLSLERFAQSVAQRRGGRFGTRRIEQELRAHHLDPASVQAALEPLRATELERAQAVWQRRFGALPAEPADYARQHRFLAQRGFSLSAIHAVLRQADLAAHPD